MALKKYSSLLTLVWVGLSLSSVGQAEEPTSFEVQKSDCQGFQLDGSAWKASSFSAPVGTSITGKKLERSGKEWLIFKYEGSAWKVEQSCFESRLEAEPSETLAAKPDPLLEEEPKEVVRSERPAVKKSKKKKTKTSSKGSSRKFSTSIFAGALIWSESLKGATPSGAALELQSSNQGFRFGLKFGLPVSKKIDLGFELGGVLGVGEIYEKGKTGASAYRASGSHLGVIASPSLNWVKKDGSWGLGVAAPFLFRSSNWPDPKTGLGLPAGKGLRSGMTVYTALSSGSWSLTPQVGVLGSMSHWVFALDIGLKLSP